MDRENLFQRGSTLLTTQRLLLQRTSLDAAHCAIQAKGQKPLPCGSSRVTAKDGISRETVADVVKKALRQ
jgi:hypothetical protein